MKVGENLSIFRATTILATLLLLVAGGSFVGRSVSAQAPKAFTPEQIAEIAIAVAGGGQGRAVLNQIRRNGIERGRVSRIGPDGRAEATADFISQQAHSIDALLRYKENESKLASAGKDKHQGIDVHVLDLTDKANRKTRYFLSARSYRVLWLEYEETPPGASAPVKYMKRFYDYRVVQNTWVPYRTVLTEDGKQTVETRISTVTYGVKMEDALFQNPEAASTVNP